MSFDGISPEAAAYFLGLLSVLLTYLGQALPASTMVTEREAAKVSSSERDGYNIDIREQISFLAPQALPQNFRLRL